MDYVFNNYQAMTLPETLFMRPVVNVCDRDSELGKETLESRTTNYVYWYKQMILCIYCLERNGGKSKQGKDSSAYIVLWDRIA